MALEPLLQTLQKVTKARRSTCVFAREDAEHAAIVSNKAGKAQKAEPCPRDKTFNTVFGQREEQTGRAASCTSPAGVLSPLRDKTNVELATVGPSRSSSYGEDSSPPAPRGLDKGKGKAPNQDEIPEQTFDPRGDPANGFLDCLQAYLETIPEHERAQLDIQPYESEEDQPAQETDFEDSFRAHLQTIPEHERAPLDFEPLVRTKGPVSAPDGSNLDKGVGPSRLREAVLRSGPKEIHRTTGRDDESDYDSEAPDSDDEIDADTEFRDDVPELVDLLDDDSDHALDVDDDEGDDVAGLSVRQLKASGRWSSLSKNRQAALSSRELAAELDAAIACEGPEAASLIALGCSWLLWDSRTSQRRPARSSLFYEHRFLVREQRRD